MTKLEETLIELGYRKVNYWYEKNVNSILVMVEPYDDIFSKIHKMYVYDHMNYIWHQTQLNNLQQAFDEMQRDLEVLKEYERNTII